jgi:hypothetical protein
LGIWGFLFSNPARHPKNGREIEKEVTILAISLLKQNQQSGIINLPLFIFCADRFPNRLILLP